MGWEGDPVCGAALGQMRVNGDRRMEGDRLAALRGTEGSCPVPPNPGTGSVPRLNPPHVPAGVSDSNVQFLMGLLESAAAQAGLGPRGVGV